VRSSFGRRTAAAAPALLMALFAGLALWRPAAIEESLEHTLVDWRFRARNALRPPAVPPNIVLVAVDDPSIARFGRWPWSRIRIAELIEKIARGKPRAIGVDLHLSEPESTWADGRIAQALSSVRDVAATGVAFDLGKPFVGALPAPLREAAITRVDRPTGLRPLEAERAQLPPEPIASAAVFGHDVYQPDARGRLRWENLYLRYGTAYIPSLALQTARIAGAGPHQPVRIRGDGRLELGDVIVPADDRGRLLINYYGGEGAFPHYSAGSVLSGQTPPEIFEGAVVFLGTVGIATYDLVATPFDENLPVLEKNATVAANVLARDFLRDAPGPVDALVVIAVGAALLLLGRRRRAALTLLMLVALAAALIGANFACFLNGWRLALCYPLLLVSVQGALTVGGRFLAEERGARRLRLMFSSYVTERVVEQLIANPEMARLGGERRELTILFSDLRGFTNFSEMQAPEEVVRTLNEYLGAMTEVVLRWEGTIDKFIGDAILSFWGAPLPQADHAERALRCALEMCGRLDRLNAAWAAAGRPSFEIGIGVNTGHVLVGNIGTEGKKMDYTVIGDQVNLCSRVEGLSKRYPSRILITENTLRQLRPLFARGVFGHLAVQSLGPVAVRGKQEPVRIYRVAPRVHGEPADIDEGGGS
jgi:adenylate cyclase